MGDALVCLGALGCTSIQAPSFVWRGIVLSGGEDRGELNAKGGTTLQLLHEFHGLVKPEVLAIIVSSHSVEKGLECQVHTI